MQPWAVALCACQSCSGPLELDTPIETRDGVVLTGEVHCPHCELHWPILAGVVLLLPEPGEYLGRYRESVLATLAEFGEASAPAVALVERYATRSVEPAHYQDDWTESEAAGALEAMALHSPDRGKAHLLFAQFLEQCKSEGLEEQLLSMMGTGHYQRIVEVGPGAGLLSQALSERCEELLLVDRSLRSVLMARQRAQSGTAKICGLVGDVCQLELASECCDRVVAANVVDIIEEPAEFLQSMARWLRSSGKALLSTPDPGLGSDEDTRLVDMLSALEFDIEEVRDAIPWLRTHSTRNSQVYWLLAVCVSV